MNGIPALANNLASQGRYGDSMLMHVSPGEVQGLQALANSQGTSLTTNPDTGLPEAFKLKDLLPTLLGVGASFLMPGLAPWMIGAGVGGVETLRTGDLGRGLMAGLGAFGGAGMASALGASAAGAAAGSGGAAAASPYALTAPAAGGAGVPSAMGGLGSGITTGAGGVTGATGMLSQGAGSMTPGAAGAFTGTGSASLAATGAPSTLSSAQPSLLSRYTSAMANPLMSANKAAIAGGLGVAAPFLQPEPVEFPEEKTRYAPQYTQSRTGPRFPSNEQILADSSEFSYFDAPQYTRINPPDSANMAGSSLFNGLSDFAGLSDEDKKRRESVPMYTLRAANGGITSLAKGGSVPMLEDGGFVLTKRAVDGLGGGDNKRGQKMASKGLGALPIRGKGHGTSDSIKTSIDGKVPARVSNGEAYVPRSKVQRAGGAKKLYALMRQAERRA